jgi:putative peptide zinc metalloprotease protein
VTAVHDAPAREGTSSREVPSRAVGVTLIGELPGSGYKAAPSLVRRSDGQTVQLTRLLYLVLEAVDGARGYDEIADEVSGHAGRRLTADQARHLVEDKLRPIGLLTRADGSQPKVRKANPLLAVKFKYVVSDPKVTRRVTAPFAVLFHPLLVLPLVTAFVVMAGWVLFREGLAAAARDAFTQPGLFLLVFAVTAVSAGFHEFGHAAACRYGGATPGAMGAGLYLVWPAFYTEVSDSYRLGRGGRVRVDLGGLYFNALFALGTYLVWLGTHGEALLLIIAAQVLQMLRQLAPFVRFDGYHLLADLTGVPDLYTHIGPTMKGLLPHGWRKPSALRWWARGIVTLWVLVVVPLLLVSLVMMVVSFPRAAATAWQSLQVQSQLLHAAWAGGDTGHVGVRLVSIAAIALPVLAMTYLLLRIVRRTTGSVWRSTRGRPVRRTLAGVLALGMLAGLAYAWWPDGSTYRPIAPGDRGTVLDAIPAAVADRVPLLRASPATAPAPVPALRDGQTGSAPATLWAGQGSPPPKDHPQIALVLVPATTAPHAATSATDAPVAAPTWVFPFNRPEAPGPGDNQALAVNTTDGSTVYDVAFALVWADGSSPVQNTNGAYALASCSACTTVAVGFQVVLVLGQANVVVPENLSAAVNYNCLQCLTYALAQQLVITLDGPLSSAGTAAVQAVWAQIQQFATGIQDVPLDQIRSTLLGYEQQIVDIVATEAGVPTPTASPLTGSATPSTGATDTTSAPGATGPTSAPDTASPTGAGGSATGSSSASSDQPTGSPTGTPTDSPSGDPATTPSPDPSSTG